MRNVWVPPKVSRELQEETQRRQGEALQSLVADQQWQWKKEFDADLNRVCPGMKLVWCPDPAPLDAVVMGARPGRWNILVPPAQGDIYFCKPLMGPNEEYVEPGSWVFDYLREQDWWNPEIQRERERAREEAKRIKRKREEAETEARQQEIFERYQAGTRTFVSMSRDTPWSQNAAGRRGVKRAK